MEDQKSSYCPCVQKSNELNMLLCNNSPSLRQERYRLIKEFCSSSPCNAAGGCSLVRPDYSDNEPAPNPHLDIDPSVDLFVLKCTNRGSCMPERGNLKINCSPKRYINTHSKDLESHCESRWIDGSNQSSKKYASAEYQPLSSVPSKLKKNISLYEFKSDESDVDSGRKEGPKYDCCIRNCGAPGVGLCDLCRLPTMKSARLGNNLSISSSSSADEIQSSIGRNVNRYLMPSYKLRSENDAPSKYAVFHGRRTESFKNLSTHQDLKSCFRGGCSRATYNVTYKTEDGAFERDVLGLRDVECRSSKQKFLCSYASKNCKNFFTRNLFATGERALSSYSQRREAAPSFLEPEDSDMTKITSINNPSTLNEIVQLWLTADSNYTHLQNDARIVDVNSSTKNFKGNDKYLGDYYKRKVVVPQIRQQQEANKKLQYSNQQKDETKFQQPPLKQQKDSKLLRLPIGLEKKNILTSKPVSLRYPSALEKNKQLKKCNSKLHENDDDHQQWETRRQIDYLELTKDQENAIYRPQKSPIDTSLQEDLSSSLTEKFNQSGGRQPEPFNPISDQITNLSSMFYDEEHDKLKIVPTPIDQPTPYVSTSAHCRSVNKWISPPTSLINKPPNSAYSGESLVQIDFDKDLLKVIFSSENSDQFTVRPPLRQDSNFPHPTPVVTRTSTPTQSVLDTSNLEESTFVTSPPTRQIVASKSLVTISTSNVPSLKSIKLTHHADNQAIRNFVYHDDYFLARDSSMAALDYKIGDVYFPSLDTGENNLNYRMPYVYKRHAEDIRILNDAEDIYFKRNRNNCRRKSITTSQIIFNEDDRTVIEQHEKSEEIQILIEKNIRRILILKNLDAELMKQLVGAMHEKKVYAGTTIITEGEQGDYFYVIQDGSYNIVSIENSTENTLTSGYFGEIALLFGTPRNATVTANTDGTLWTIERETFRHIVVKGHYRLKKKQEEIIKGIAWLKHLTQSNIEKIVDALENLCYTNGKRIIKQGDDPDMCYFVVKGRVIVTILKETTGEEIVVNIIKEGGYFGELAFVLKNKRAASVYAHGNVQLAGLDAKGFQRLTGSITKKMQDIIYEYNVLARHAMEAAVSSSHDDVRADGNRN